MCFDVSDVSADVFLKLFGEHFFTFCKQAGYDTMLRTLGGNLIEFIGNLDALHSYLALSYQVCSCVSLFLFASCCQLLITTPPPPKRKKNKKTNRLWQILLHIFNYILTVYAKWGARKMSSYHCRAALCAAYLLDRAPC